MYLFVDESGTNKQTGTSVIAIVAADEKTMLASLTAVVAAEKASPNKTFHWKDSAWPVREVFLREINSLPFKAYCSQHKNPIRNFAEVLESSLIGAMKGEDVKAIILDGRKGRAYERGIKKALRDQGLSSRKLRTGNDEAYPLLRVADAYAGLMRNYYNQRSLHSVELYEMVKKHVN